LDGEEVSGVRLLLQAAAGQRQTAATHRSAAALDAVRDRAGGAAVPGVQGAAELVQAGVGVGDELADELGEEARVRALAQRAELGDDGRVDRARPLADGRRGRDLSRRCRLDRPCRQESARPWTAAALGSPASPGSRPSRQPGTAGAPRAALPRSSRRWACGVLCPPWRGWRPWPRSRSSPASGSPSGWRRSPRRRLP
jgi:hypothetical protein